MNKHYYNEHEIFSTKFQKPNLLPIYQVKKLNTKRLNQYRLRVLKTLSYYKNQNINKMSCCDAEYFYHPHYDSIVDDDFGITKYIAELENYYEEIKKELSIREHIT